MNIFILDENIQTCAQMHNDRHVVKMIVETAQLLSTVHHVTGSAQSYMYRRTHVNHPCAKWARQSVQNYMWLCQLGLAVCQEYTHRYQKIHKTQQRLVLLINDVPNLPNRGLTPWALAMPEYCKISDDVVMAYRNYYIQEKQHLAKWKHRDMPAWFIKDPNFVASKRTRTKKKKDRLLTDPLLF